MLYVGYKCYDIHDSPTYTYNNPLSKDIATHIHEKCVYYSLSKITVFSIPNTFSRSSTKNRNTLSNDINLDSNFTHSLLQSHIIDEQSNDVEICREVHYYFIV